MVSIRALGPEDWRLWKDIRLRALADSPDAFGRTYEEESQRTDAEWQERVADAGSVRLVAERDGRPVAMASSWIEPDVPSIAHVFAMWVDPSVRREGIGRTLLERAIEWARDRGAAEAVLSVTEGNDAAHEMYVRAGFVATGEREPLREGSNLYTLTMRRKLSS